MDMTETDIFIWCQDTFERTKFIAAWDSDDPEIWEFAVPFEGNIINVTIEFVYEWHSIEFEFSSSEDEKNFYSLVREEEKKRRENNN